jgi:uncharacterized protein YunC (DUF1805 family)
MDSTKRTKEDCAQCHVGTEFTDDMMNGDIGSLSRMANEIAIGQGQAHGRIFTF